MHIGSLAAGLLLAAGPNAAIQAPSTGATHVVEIEARAEVVAAPKRVTLPGGDILLALSFAAEKARPRSVVTARCAFDGTTLAVKATGDALEHAHGRGLLEPSLVSHNGRFLMTLRAEDQRGSLPSGAEPAKQWTRLRLRV